MYPKYARISIATLVIGFTIGGAKLSYAKTDNHIPSDLKIPTKKISQNTDPFTEAVEDHRVSSILPWKLTAVAYQDDSSADPIDVEFQSQNSTQNIINNPVFLNSCTGNLNWSYENEGFKISWKANQDSTKQKLTTVYSLQDSV